MTTTAGQEQDRAYSALVAALRAAARAGMTRSELVTLANNVAAEENTA